MEVSLVALWAGALLALTLLGTPIARWLFRPLPLGGTALGLPVALAWLTLGTFWVGHWRHDAIGIGAVVLALLALAVVAHRRGPDPPERRLVEPLLVVLVAFLVMAWFRAGDPAVVPYAGEKFLDYSLVSAILRAEALPPADPWFAGEPVRYYYGGHLLVASLAVLTGTSAAFAYNLGFATVFAAAAVAAYGVAAELSAELEANPRLGGGLGLFFVALAGNLGSPARLIGWALPGGLGDRWAGIFHLGEGGLLEGPGAFHYWDDSRVIPAEPDAFDYLINEFPLFAFVHGDLHAHLMALPFVALLAGTLFAWYRVDGGRHRTVLLAGVVPALLGVLLIVNTWSVVTGVGLVAVTVALAARPPVAPAGPLLVGEDRALERLARRVLVGLAVALAVVLLAAILVVPYVLSTRADAAIGVLPHRTPLASTILIYGGLLAAVVPGVLAMAERDRGRWPVVFGGLVAAVAVAAILGVATLAILGAVVAVAAWLILGRGRWSFALVLVLAGAGLAGSLEVLYVDDPASWERLNTVFKLGFEAWILLGLAAGALLASVVDRTVSVPLDGADLRLSGLALAVALVLLLGLYGAFALGAHVETARESPTLDARTYLLEGHPQEAGAIGWLDARSGTLTIAEAPGDRMYRWASPASSFTGHATVAGWGHAANYQDDRDGYRERVAALEAIYAGTQAERAAAIDRYGVDLVYVGPTERERYGVVDFAGDPHLSVAYEDEWVTIYEAA